MMTINVAKTFDGSGLPSGESFTYPYTFDEPIPLHVKYSYKATRISDEKIQEYVTQFNGYITGYPNASAKYPCLFVSPSGNSTGQFSGGVTFTGISGTQKRYLDGQETASYNITSFNNDSISWSTSMFSNFIVTIEECSIPVILQTYDDTLLYEEEYYYLNQITGSDTNAWAVRQVNDGYELSKIFNSLTEEYEEKLYEFSTIASNYTMDEFGNLTENESEGERYRGLRIKIKGLASLYKIPGISDGNLKYGIKISTTPIICYYSTDYGNTWQNVPGQPTTLPFDFIWRPYEEEDGEGTFWASVGEGDNKNLYIFDNEEDALEYISGQSDGRKASNYGKITSGDFNNPTGEDNEETEFGTVYTQGFFSQQYIMSTGALSALANDLYDTQPGGIWEDIKKGLDMYGANPMDAVMGLSFFPLDLTSIYSSITASHVWFGGYGWEPTGGTCNRVIAPNGYKSLGSITISRTFRNWRDYSPYTRLYVSLPYCGVYELDLNRYYDKNVEVRYFFDTRTNGCIACLIADGHLMDYYNGQIGVTMPITLTDFSNYANSQINTLLGFGGQAASTGINAASSAGQLAAAGTGAATLGIVGAGVAGAAIGAKAVYGLSMNNINKFNVTKGGSSSMINEYLPQYVEFTFEIQEDCAPDNYGQLYGYPSMMTGSVGSFSGFLKCQSIKLNCANATEAERNEIKQLLMSGIYI